MGHQAPDTDQPAIKTSSPPRPPGSPLALRNWRVTWRLIALIAIPTMMGLVFGGLRLAAANSSANEFSQVRHLAVVGQQVTGLVQALEDERDITTGYVAAGRPATRFAQLKKQYAVTDAWVARVGNLATDSGIGIPPERLAQLNDRLDNPPVADVSVSRHMGLFAVSHLAARHGVRVRLRAGTPRGLTALIWIPETLVTAPGPATVAWPDADDHPAPGAPQRSADALRTRLSGLQQGTRRAEQDAAANRARGPMIP